MKRAIFGSVLVVVLALFGLTELTPVFAQGKSPQAELQLRVQALEQQVQVLQQQSGNLTAGLNALQAQLADIGAQLAALSQSTQDGIGNLSQSVQSTNAALNTL